MCIKPSEQPYITCIVFMEISVISVVNYFIVYNLCAHVLLYEYFQIKIHKVVHMLIVIICIELI